MKKLSIETWKNIFRNLSEINEEVEVFWLDSCGDEEQLEWCLVNDCEFFEGGYKTEKEARQRLNKLIDLCK